MLIVMRSLRHLAAGPPTVLRKGLAKAEPERLRQCPLNGGVPLQTRIDPADPCQIFAGPPGDLREGDVALTKEAKPGLPPDPGGEADIVKADGLCHSAVQILSGIVLPQGVTLSREKITSSDKVVAGAIGARLRLLRGGESQRSFAVKAGLKPPHWNRYETGGRIPSPEVFARIAAVKGASLHWLITGEGPMYAEQLTGLAAEEMREYRAKREDPELSRLVEAVTTIVQSNNSLVIQALKTNLEVFLRALDQNSRRRR